MSWKEFEMVSSRWGPGLACGPDIESKEVNAFSSVPSALPGRHATTFTDLQPLDDLVDLTCQMLGQGIHSSRRGTIVSSLFAGKADARRRRRGGVRPFDTRDRHGAGSAVSQPQPRCFHDTNLRDWMHRTRRSRSKSRNNGMVIVAING